MSPAQLEWGRQTASYVELRTACFIDNTKTCIVLTVVCLRSHHYPHFTCMNWVTELRRVFPHQPVTVLASSHSCFVRHPQPLLCPDSQAVWAQLIIFCCLQGTSAPSVTSAMMTTTMKARWCSVGSVTAGFTPNVKTSLVRKSIYGQQISPLDYFCRSLWFKKRWRDPAAKIGVQKFL